jgi:hypothetical protein
MVRKRLAASKIRLYCHSSLAKLVGLRLSSAPRPPQTTRATQEVPGREACKWRKSPPSQLPRLKENRRPGELIPDIASSP